MSEIKWTDAQQAAINVKANKILVSAAAGSGKSTVLTARIISSVTDTNAPSDISRKLVVTFTRASAEDLKSKIASAVQKAVSASPNNKYLTEQLLKLPSAHIGTIHGICFSLIKSNFHSLGLPASLRIADESEIAALKPEILSKLIDEAYTGIYSGISDFASFAENFVTERDDKLTDIFLDLYEKIKNQPNGFDVWRHSAENMRSFDNFGDTPFGKLLCDKVLILTDFLKQAYSKALTYFEGEEAYAKACSTAFSSEYDYICVLEEQAKKYDYFAVKEHLQKFTPTRLGAIRQQYKTDEGEFYRSIRACYTENIKALRDTDFSYTEEEIRSAAEKNSEYCLSLTEILSEFDKRFSEEKLRRCIIDFNDIEHLTLKLLYNKDGTFSDTALAISSSFDEIFVDEYQDVNPLQNMIFAALSVNCPIFMVGDIKQSIYNFRGAVPEIFSDYRRAFTPYVSGKNDYENVTVFLSDNFRSKFPVTEFSNAVSDALFTNPDNALFDKRIPYLKSDRLVCNKNSEGAPIVKLLISEPAPKEEQTVERGSYSLESEMVANTIAELVRNGTPPSDIAILLRSPKNSAFEFETQLKKRGISVSSDKGAKLFDAPEVQLALCLLNCADNPYRDIFLAGALKSPFFNFTMDELIEIRRFSDEQSLFSALNVYTEAKSFKKGLRFLDFLNKIRKESAEVSVDKLLWNIYVQTSFFTAIYDGGSVSEAEASSRRSNLLALHRMAKEYSSSGRSGLFPFLERIRLLIENDNSPASASMDGNGVKIMSIHSSKGLEFEHCFVCGTNHLINKSDLSSDIISDPELGIAMRIKDDLRLTSFDTVFRLSLSCLIEQRLLDEEMRMLYVALTRAKTALYVSANCAKFDDLNNACLYGSKISHPFTYLRGNSYIKWILTAIKAKTDLRPQFETELLSEKEIEEQSKKLLGSDISDKVLGVSLTAEEENKLYLDLKSRLSFVYPHRHAVELPSKLSVSKLYPEILDEDNYLGDNVSFENGFIFDNVIDEPQNNASKMIVPQFLSENNGVSGAERGIATHVFMQFCDFSHLTIRGIESEIARLTEQKFILPAHAELIDRKTVNAFLKSDIFREMQASDRIEREYRFNIKFPASEFTSDENLQNELKDEFIFVQGVIDCYFYDQNGKITLLDYKTDRIPSEIFGKKAEEDSFFVNKYSNQLSYYRAALNKLCGKAVSKTVIYSFALGRCIIIP